jgi:hypothetical protein
MRFLSLGLVAGGLLFAGCSGANPSSGQRALFRIQNAQYIAGPIDTSPRDPSPAVANVSTQNNDLFPGVSNKKISGSVGPNSTAVLVGLQGDVGHWVVPVQDLDQNTIGNYTFSFSASFSPLTPAGDAGNLLLVLRATTRDGQVGPPYSQAMQMDQPRIAGALVISLDWDTEADLDLHVQLPSDGDAGVNEIWSRKPSGLPPATASTAPTVDAGMQAGYLDFDSNSQCVIDGRRAENVIFPTTAPNGRYVVRVDTFSLCGEATARWRVRVFTNNGADPVLQAVGQSTDIDTRFPHGQGAGVQALVFDY